jgi:hypothetical protein
VRRLRLSQNHMPPALTVQFLTRFPERSDGLKAGDDWQLRHLDLNDLLVD